MSAKSNRTVLSFTKETSNGVRPDTPDWTAIDWNELSVYGASVDTVARTPVNEDLMEYEGTVSDLNSNVDFQTDLTLSSFKNFSEGIFASVWKAQKRFSPTAVTATGYTVASDGDLTENTLIFAKKFQDSANNGLKVVGPGSTTTEVKTSGLVVETSPPTGASITVAGFQGATGDIELDSSGDLISTTLDFQTLGIQVGQSIYIGGSTIATQFDTATYKGLARVRLVTTNKITLDKRDWTVGAADNGSGKTIQIFIGSFIRNVPQNHSDFLSPSYSFESVIEGMTEGTQYEYPNGNKVNTVTLDMPLSDKAGISYAFIGMDTPDMSGTQETGNRHSTYDKGALGTTSDFARLSIKDSDLVAYDSAFKNLSIEINRNVSAEKALANLGAIDMNIGTLQVSGTASVILNDSGIVKAAKNNTTTTMDFAMNNDDGALHFDFPSCKFGSANKSFPVNESILVDVEIKTFKDDFFGYVFSCTHYPYLPI